VPADVSGQVLLNGRQVQEMKDIDRGRLVGCVFQSPDTQLFNLTVGEEVAFGPLNAGMADAEVRERVTWALNAVRLGGREDEHVQALSGGERQRLAVASVIAMRPPVLMLDEPLSSLDVHSTRRLAGVLADLSKAEGTTIVVAEHRLHEGASLSTRTVLLNGGTIVADGPTPAVLADRARLRALGLRRPASREQSAWEALIGSPARVFGERIVRVSGVGVSFGRRHVLRSIDLDIHEGEFVALVGDNGAGKTTLARVLAGMLRPSRGAVQWRRPPVPGRDVGILLQDPRCQLFCETVSEELAFGPENFGLDPDPVVTRLLDATDLTHLAGAGLHELSSGQRHRAAMAAVLALDPRLLILDEPTLGQDWNHLERLMNLADELRRHGGAVLLVTHDYKLIHHHATRVVLLRDGHVAADGMPALTAGSEEPDEHVALSRP
jgi:energy-coupling factor transport system ATP-binding protein